MRRKTTDRAAPDAAVIAAAPGADVTAPVSAPSAAMPASSTAAPAPPAVPAPGGFVPAMEPLPLRRHYPAPRFAAAAADGALISLRDYSFREDLLVLFLHGPNCPECRRIVAEMDSRRGDWEGWGTSLLLLLTELGAEFEVPDRQAYDPGGAIRRLYTDDAPADAAVAVIEHRGRFMEGWMLTHPNPVDWHQVAEAVRWVAVQEPECGACEVLDGWDGEPPEQMAA